MQVKIYNDVTTQRGKWATYVLEKNETLHSIVPVANDHRILVVILRDETIDPDTGEPREPSAA
jgi:hypothetical protein